MNILKRFIWTILIIAVYFTVWKELRSAFTSHIIIPQIEYASTQCSVPLSYEIASNTAIVLHRKTNDDELATYRFNAPAGFYILFGILVLTLLGGGKKVYIMILGYHVLFTLFTVSTFYLGLCYLPVFLHLSSAGNSYFTPFFTFFVLIYLMSPTLKNVLNHNQKETG